MLGKLKGVKYMKSKRIISLIMSAGLIVSSIGATTVKADSVDTTGAAVTVTSVPPSVTGTSSSSIDGFINACLKGEQITSAEQKETDFFSIKVDGLDLDKLGAPKAEQGIVNMVLQQLQNIPITADTKINTNADKTIITMQSNVSVTIMNKAYPFNVWIIQDKSNGKNNVKEIFEIPEWLKALISSTIGGQASNSTLNDILTKKYLVIDTAKFTDSKLATKDFDMTTINKFTEDFTKELIQALIVELKDSNGTSNIVTKVSDSKYQVTINNNNLKVIIKDLLSNSSLQQSVTDYAVSIAKSQATSEGKTLTDADISKIGTEIKALIVKASDYLPEVNEFIDLFNLNVNGNYEINDAGFISHKDGNATLKVDVNKITEYIANLSGNKATSTKDTSLDAIKNIQVTFGLKYNTDITNINGNVVIDAVPTTTADNSIDYFDLVMKNVGGKGNTKTTPVTAGTRKFNKKYAKDLKKSWTIKFNQKLSVATVNSSNVKIVDDSSNVIDANVQLIGDGKIIKITPKVNYVKGVNYHIVVGTGVTTEAGTALPKVIVQDFNLQ